MMFIILKKFILPLSFKPHSFYKSFIEVQKSTMSQNTVPSAIRYRLPCYFKLSHLSNPLLQARLCQSAAQITKSSLLATNGRSQQLTPILTFCVRQLLSSTNLQLLDFKSAKFELTSTASKMFKAILIINAHHDNRQFLICPDICIPPSPCTLHYFFSLEVPVFDSSIKLKGLELTLKNFMKTNFRNKMKY